MPVLEGERTDLIPLVTILTVIPAGVALAIVATVKHRASSRKATPLRIEPAKVLFPDSDPVADEYQATKPFIEALEMELGTKLETATSISDLLEKYSGKNKVSSG
jgi:hypothetical protein